ncbi:hypothetical protein AAE250_06685 [Bacteroides sp. GD17]|jgi:hypothetical protein|uniref:hypothetical protein n=1 Tax=Bacteroides sp. GD17 TaxID=3139826 RepID=UPI0025F4306A|nr:hypothetical protein [uncultured Bacteroides sp.]
MKSYKYLLPVLLLALAACTDQDNINPGNTSEDNPNTPVSFSLTLQGMTGTGSNSNTRTRIGNSLSTRSASSTSTAADLAAIPAIGEITASTRFDRGNGALTMYLPGVTKAGDFSSGGSYYPTGSYYYLQASTDATLGAPAWQYINEEGQPASLPQLYMKDFSHDRSRLGLVTATNYGYDNLYAITQRASQEAGLTYQYTLHHTTAKVSLLLQDKDRQPIPAADINTVSIHSYATYSGTDNIISINGQPMFPGILIRSIDARSSASRSSASRSNASPTHATFYTWANTPDADGNLPGPDDLEIAYTSNRSSQSYFTNPANASSEPGTIPTGLWNALIAPNPTHTETSRTYTRLSAGDTYTGEDINDSPFSIDAIATGHTYPKAAPGYTGSTTGSSQQPLCVAPYLPATDATAKKTHILTVTLRDGGSALPAGTYSIPLSSIALTTLPENDGRRNDFDPNTGTNTGNSTGPGTLKYLLPGEHLLVVLTLDRQQGLTATATIGDWSLTNVDLGNMGDPEDTSGDIVKD